MQKNIFKFTSFPRKMHEGVRFSAFTLAEVLIALSVIGIIAAITIPNVIQKNTKKATVIQVRKIYSILESSLSQLIIENNNENIDFNQYPRNASGAGEVFEDFIKPYVKINYDAGTNQTKKQNIMDCNPMSLLNGTPWNANYCTNDKYYAVQLKDGSTLIMRGYQENGTDNQKTIYFAYDVNGKKGPNTLAKDIFTFDISPGTKNKTYIREITKDDLESCVSVGAAGWTCVKWIIAKGNMDYLDCPGNYDFNNNKCR